MFKHRSLMGNACLVVLLAFILTTVPGVPGVGGGTGVARAQGPTVGNLDFSEAGKVKIPIGSVTSSSYTSLSLKLSFQGADGNTLAEFDINYPGSIGSTKVLVYDNTTYGKIYAQVYQGTLTLEYLPGSGINIPTTSQSVYAYIYEPTGQSIYLDLRFRPPTPSGGAGGGGGGTPPPTTVETDYGTATVSGNTVTVSLDPANVAKLLDETVGETQEIKLPAQVQAGSYEVEIPADVVARAEEKAKALAFVTADASLTLPPGAVDPDEVRKLAPDAKLTVVVGRVSDDEAGQLLAAVVPVLTVDQSAVGGVYEFDLKAVAGTGGQAREERLTLARPVRVTVAFEGSKVGSAARPYLGLYRFENGTWSYRKSWVQPGANEVTGQLYSFSKYTVMTYRKRFVDTATHWAFADVDLMASKHVVRGVDGLAFNPDGKVTRAEFAAMVVRALGLPEAPGAAAFGDVAAGAWYAGVVGAAAKAGVVTGMGDGTFRPNDRVTREQMAVMLARALKAAGKSVAAERVGALLAAFSDQGRISRWAREGVAAAVEAAVIRGRPGGVFDPAEDATRAEAASMLRRYLAAVGQL